MTKRVITFVGIGLALGFWIAASQYFNHPAPEPRVVAHSGGSAAGHVYTNSLEALNQSYSAGFQWFELDLEWTSDGELVLLHDWDSTFTKFFGEPPGRRSVAEFTTLRMIDGLTQLTVRQLGEWLTTHPGAMIVTDIKTENLQGLYWIVERLPDLSHRFIPQVYSFPEYSECFRIGFRRCLLTIYRYPGVREIEIEEFARIKHLPILVMPQDGALAGDLPRRLQTLGVKVYAHTVNDPNVATALLQKGVYGIYSNFIGPELPLPPMQ